MTAPNLTNEEIQRLIEENSRMNEENRQQARELLVLRSVASTPKKSENEGFFHKSVFWF